MKKRNVTDFRKLKLNIIRRKKLSKLNQKKLRLLRLLSWIAKAETWSAPDLEQLAEIVETAEIMIKNQEKRNGLPVMIMGKLQKHFFSEFRVLLEKLPRLLFSESKAFPLTFTKYLRPPLFPDIKLYFVPKQ